MNDEGVPISTKYGTVYLTPTDGNHIYVDIKPGYLTVRGVEYNGSFHCYRWSDDNFRLGMESETEYNRTRSAWLKRKDWLTRPTGDDGPSTSTRDLLINEVQLHVNAWAAVNQDILDLAQLAHLKEQVSKQVEEVRQAQERLDNAKAVLGAYQDAVTLYQRGMSRTTK